MPEAEYANNLKKIGIKIAISPQISKMKTYLGVKMLLKNYCEKNNNILAFFQKYKFKMFYLGNNFLRIIFPPR
jgi:hypothetical protein